MTAEQMAHCRDCCCARSWKALGITDYTGLSIPEHIQQLREALERIATGDGYYGAQAREYKEIARKALGLPMPEWPAEHGQFGVGA